MSFVVGLTGGIGSGKTTVAKLFADKGITIIDTDQLARDVIEPGQPALQKIQKKFGSTILLPDGSLNRGLLRQIIFKDADKRIWLEQLLHPLIREEIKRLVKASSSPYSIVVIPLLFESQPNPIINRILTVDVSEESQIHRTHLRDKIPHDEIQAILKTQVNRELRKAKSHDIITNNETINELIPQVDQLHQIYLSLANTHKKTINK